MGRLSVSYTHLEVYKRQALSTSAGQSADASMLSAILEKAGFSCDIETSIGADSFDTSAYKLSLIHI